LARTALTTTVLQPDSVANNLTSGAAATVTSGAGNGVTVPNTGSSFLAVIVGSTACTATVVVGSTVLGQAVTSFTVVLTTSATNILGPFHSALNAPGTQVVSVDFSSATNVTVGAFQLGGTY
jgi:hypothetical protein